MALKIKKQIASTLSWSASTTVTQALPREGLITRVVFRVTITMSGSGAIQPDGPFRIADALKILGDGGRTFVGHSGEQVSRIAHLLNVCDFATAFVTEDSLNSGNTTYDVAFVFHFGSNPADPWDLSAAIPAKDLSTLDFEWQTTGNDEVDDALTISSATGYLEVYEVIDMTTPDNLMVPLSSTTTWAHDANYSDLSKEIDVPTGSYLRRLAMLVQDDTATRPVRKDDEISEVGIKLPKISTRLVDQRWHEAQLATALQYPGFTLQNFHTADSYTTRQVLQAGLAVVDFRRQAHPLYGLDLRGYQSGDIKLGLSVTNYASGDDTIIFYDQLTPIRSTNIR